MIEIKTFYAEGSTKETKGSKNGAPIDTLYSNLSAEDKTIYDNFYSTFCPNLTGFIEGYPEMISLLQLTDAEPLDEGNLFVYDELSEEDKNLISAFVALI